MGKPIPKCWDAEPDTVARWIYEGAPVKHKVQTVDRATLASALRRGRRFRQVHREGVGRYLLIGMISQVITTR